MRHIYIVYKDNLKPFDLEYKNGDTLTYTEERHIHIIREVLGKGYGLSTRHVNRFTFVIIDITRP